MSAWNYPVRLLFFPVRRSDARCPHQHTAAPHGTRHARFFFSSLDDRRTCGGQRHPAQAVRGGGQRVGDHQAPVRPVKERAHRTRHTSVKDPNPSVANVCRPRPHSYFDADAVACIEGGPAISQAILRERFDKIFYTGPASSLRSHPAHESTTDLQARLTILLVQATPRSAASSCVLLPST